MFVTSGSSFFSPKLRVTKGISHRVENASSSSPSCEVGNQRSSGLSVDELRSWPSAFCLGRSEMRAEGRYG